MNHSGDAAEQIVRMSLEGVEVAVKITGTAAKEIATFLVTALKNKNSKLKPKGKARLISMLKSGKALEIFSVKERDLKKFAQGAKQYGIVYCVLRNRRNSPDGLCDIMVKADDAPKISRVVERFKFGRVDKAKIESEIIRSQAERTQDDTGQPAPDRNDTEKLLDDLLGTKEGKAGKEAPDPLAEGGNPPQSHPSAPTSENKSRFAGGTLSKKPSVKEAIREIKAARAKQEAETPKRKEKTQGKPKANSFTNHKQPQAGGKSKFKKTKARN